MAKKDPNKDIIAQQARLEQRQELLLAINKENRKSLEYQKLELELIKTAIKYEEVNIENLQNKNKFQKEDAEELISLTKELEKRQQEILDIEKELTQEKQKQNEELKKQQEYYESIGDYAEDFLKTTLGLTKEMTRTEKVLSAGSKGISIWSKRIIDVTGNFQNWARMLRAKVIESTIAFGYILDETVTKISSLTGRMRDFDGVITSAAVGMKTAGVTISESGDSFLALSSGLTGFIDLSKKEQVSLVRTTSVLSQLGVDAQMTADSLEILTKSFGYTVEESIGITEELALASKELGRPISTLVKDFAAATPHLVQYGNRSIKIFKELEIASRKTGASLDQMIGVIDQLDTFSGAAEAAADLGATLGVFIDAYALFDAEGENKIKLYQEAIERSGLSWETMGRRMKAAVAEASGFDITTASELFSTQAIAARNAAPELDKYKESLEDMAKASQQLRKIGMAIVEQFAIALRPVITTVKDLAVGFSGWFDSLNETFKGAFSIVVLLGGAFGLFAISLGGAAAMGTSLGAGMTGASKGITSLGSSLRTFPMKGMVAFAGFVVSIGASIALASYGISIMADSFSKLNSDQILGVALALGIFVLGLVALSAIAVTVGAPAAVALGVLALVALSFGAAVTLAGLGIKLMAESLDRLLSGNKAEQWSSLVAGLGGLSAVIADFPVMRSIAFSVTMSGMSSMISEINKIEASKLKLGIGLASAGAYYNESAAASQEDGAMSKLLKAVQELNSNVKGGNSAKPEFNVYIGNRAIDSHLVKVMKKELGKTLYYED